MALLVFVCHTSLFNGSPITNSFLGPVAVNYFFVVSGMMMANSAKKKNITGNYGKASVDFVLKKVKMLFPAFIAAEIPTILAKIVSLYISGTIHSVREVFERLINAVPELFFVSESGIFAAYYDETMDGWYNSPVWYISAMCLLMLPLAYMLFKNSDFTTHVFAPIVGVFTLGFSCCLDLDHQIPILWTMSKLFPALMGLCFGICAYNIYIKLKNTVFNTKAKTVLTIVEVLAYAAGFFALSTNVEKTIMCSYFLLPFAVAITFSGKSYVGYLFRAKWMKCFAPLSLQIYLNHWVVIGFVTYACKNLSYAAAVAVAAALTALMCVYNVIAVRIFKKIWAKLKPAFTASDKEDEVK